MINQDENNLITVKEMIEILKISRSKAYELIKERDFPSIKIGRIIRIDKKMLFEWLHNTKIML